MKTTKSSKKAQNRNRFDIAALGLSDAQLRSIAGGKPGPTTRVLTAYPDLGCCV